MSRSVRTAVLLAITIGTASTASPLQAQVTRADSAAVLLDAAQAFRARGDTRVADEILRMILRRFPDTPSAELARGRSEETSRELEAGRGKTGFVVWNTLYGSFLGLAVPAAFGADEPEAFGAGLLVGAPLGFFASKAYANSRDLTAGQSGLISFATFWGTWQGFGWRDVLDIGTTQNPCQGIPGGVCGESTSDTAPWTAGVIGGLTGLGAGLYLARHDISSGTSSLIFNASLWGTWYGTALGILTDLEDDDLLTAILLGGNAGILASIPAAKAWNPSTNKVRLVSIAGVAGGVAGLGLDLLFNVDGDKAAVGIPTATATIGLVAGALLYKDRDRGIETASSNFQNSLLSLGEKPRWGVPLPMPARIRFELPNGTSGWRPGVRLMLVNGTF